MESKTASGNSKIKQKLHKGIAVSVNRLQSQTMSTWNIVDSAWYRKLTGKKISNEVDTKNVHNKQIRISKQSERYEHISPNLVKMRYGHTFPDFLVRVKGKTKRAHISKPWQVKQTLKTNQPQFLNVRHYLVNIYRRSTEVI